MSAAWAVLLLAWMAAGDAPARPTCSDDAAAVPPAKAGPARFTGSDAYRALRRSGREVVAEKTLDLDADGRLDALVVSSSDEGLELSAYRNTPDQGFVLLSRSTSLAGEELVRFESLAIGDRPGFVLDVIEDSPDEADHQLALFVANPAGLAQVLTTSWRVKHSEADAGRRDEDIIDLGGRPLGFSIMASDPGQWPVAELRYAPKEVVFSEGDRKPVRIVIGTRVRRFRREAGRYAQADEWFANHLVPVTGLAEGPPGSARPIKSPMDWSWRATELPSALRLSWPTPEAIRVVGLANCQQPGPQAGAVRRMKIGIGADAPLVVDLDHPNLLDPRLAGVGTYALGRTDTTLVFLRQPIQAGELTVTVDGTAPTGAGFCVSAVMPFGAKADTSATSSASSTPP